MRVSPIFNVSYLYPYKVDVVEESKKIQDKTKEWGHQMLIVKPMEINKILDRRIAKRTRNK